MTNYDAYGWNIDDPSDLINYVTGDQYDTNGWNRSGYDINGYNAQGWNAQGWNIAGNNQATGNAYDSNGYNVSGYNAQGWNSSGINQTTGGGYDITGLDISGNYVTPDPPTNLTATIQSNTEILLEWTASATGGNGLIYRIYDQNDGTIHNGTISTNVTITRYIPNVNTYKFRIVTIMTSSAYASSFSDWSNEVTFPNVMMPVDLLCTFSNNTISLGWQAPPDVSITDYIIEEVTGALSLPIPSEPPIGWTPSNYTVSTGGLINYTFSDLLVDKYKFHVYAENANGERSNPAISDLIDLTPPDAPTNLSYSLGSASITLNWDAPTGVNPRNSEITEYRITYHTGDEAFMLTTSTSNTEVSKTIPELYNDTTYYFKVASLYDNSEGLGSLFSEYIIFDTIIVPNTPWTPQAPTMSVNGDSTFYIEWPPNLFETYILTKYVVTVFHSADNGNGMEEFTDEILDTNDGLTLNITTGSLTPGTNYYCSVIAQNEHGSSSPSSFSESVMAATFPSAPSNVSATLGVESLEITWDPSTDNGYSDIITYNIYNQDGNFVNNQWSPGSAYSATYHFKGDLFLTSIYITAQNAAGESDPSETYYINGSLQPDPPTNVIAVAKNGAALISWTAPTTVVETGVTEYIVTSYPDGYSSSCIVSLESLVLTGLTNGVEYTFTVIAANSGASSVESDPSNPVTPFTEPPSAPRNILVSPRSASAVVSWEPSTYDGGSEITGYRIVSVPDNKIQTVGPDITSVTMTGLKNGTSYTFRVFGVNAIGFSGQSNSITPYALPGNPKIGVPVIGNNTVTLSWTAVPGAVASPITAYKLTRSDDETFLVTIGGGNSGTYEITEGLTIGTPVTFYVRSVSAIGQSLLATPIIVTPLSLPSAPTNFMVTPIMTGPVANQGKFATLTWAVPDSIGGTPITGYVVTYNSFTSPLIGASVRIFLATGLTNGEEVTFNIVARNKLGSSEPSSYTINPSNASGPSEWLPMPA